jgi:hypothetical protein
MRLTKYLSRAGGRKGFALLVAVAVLTILMFSGAAIQRMAYEEMMDVGRAVGRTRARLAASGGLEAGLAEVKGFMAGNEPERSIEGSLGEIRYGVSMQKANAGGIGPALDWLPPEREVAVLTIEGVLERGDEAAGGRSPVFHRAVAVVDPAGTRPRVLLWINE